MDVGGRGRTITLIVGPLPLGAVSQWALLRNRKQTPQETDRTEQATRHLYRAEDAEHAGEGNERMP